MEVNEENVQMILSMGFPSESEVRRALRMAKNDLSDAVAILTNDHPVSSYDALEEVDIDMKDPQTKAVQGPVYGPSLPPSYDEVIDSTENGVVEVTNGEECAMEESNSLEFPVTNLYELEVRVFTEMWNIPYKREESLGRCLIAATRLAEAGLCESDEHCKRFVDRCMPEAFQKLLTSLAVDKWNSEIQEGIFNMLLLLIDLIAARLQHRPLPVLLMDTLTLAFNPETEFQHKNRVRRDTRNTWDEKFKSSELPAQAPASTYRTSPDPFGWLTHLINHFAFKGGFDVVKKILEEEELDVLAMAALLKPFGICAEFLNSNVATEVFSLGLDKAIKYIQKLEEVDFKEKKIGSVSDLLTSMKLMSLHLWPGSVDALDDLRLDVANRMLRCPHFNAKMNALKEVTKLIEECSASKVSRTAIHSDKILDWLVENRILSVALEGNIDQAQYCDKIKGIVDFLGSRLSIDELTMIWRMQNGQTNNVIDNIHSIVAAAAVKFDAQQLEHLFLLIQKKWQDDNDRMREKLLSLIGKIGKDARVPKTTTRVLELLWDLAHLPALSRHLVEQAQEEHHAILSDSYSVKEQVKLQYVAKCIEDIKKGACVLPALRQLINISKNIIKQSFQKADKGVIHELNKNYEVMKLVTNSLVKCHKQALSMVGESSHLTPNTLVDGRYSHLDYMLTHLNFLQYVLQEGVLYLPWNRARDIWSTLVANPRACDWDRETCYDWMQKGLMDLELETQTQLFQKEILRLEPAKLSEKGFLCFKCFFESVNIKEHKLKRCNNVLVVEKGDLIGLDFLWEVCLHIPDESIADSAIQLLLNMSYNNLNSRLKKDPLILHRKFISECYNRLEMAMIGVCGNVVAQTVSNATKILTATVVPEVANVPLPSRSVKLLAIERLLWIAEAYVLSVEELHCTPRTILPHAAAFHGYPLTLSVKCEALHQEFTVLCHSNESLGSLRKKILSGLSQPQEHIQIHANEKLLCMTRDHKLLHQLEILDGQVVQVRLGSASLATSTTSGSSSPSVSTKPPEPSASATTSKQNFEYEQEKMLPGVVMAKGGEVFDMLYQLTELDEPKITKRVQKLLMLIPTDPAVAEALETLGQKTLKQASSSEDVTGNKSSPRKSPNSGVSSPRQSPREIMKTLFDSSAPDMSLFRVLYNLEVLSSKLMPTQVETGSVAAVTQAYCEEFLNNGGLSIVVNVLQPEAMPPDINYEIRQGCYSICLQLARYLLCGLTVTEEASKRVSSSPMPRVCATLVIASPSHSPAKTAKTSGSQAIQTLSMQEFIETVSCFMRVTWAGAAGRLHLLSYNQPIREAREGASCGHRSRQSSTGSSASTNSDSDCQSLHAGVCAHQTNIPTKDANIAREALEILITCLQLRSELISSFYSLPYLSDFIIDLLVGCPLPEMRSAMCEQLWTLCQLSPPPSSPPVQPPRHFVLQLLQRAYLPFWVTSSSTRGSTQKLLGQCSQYFDLRCRLLENLSSEDQNDMQIDIESMLEDEIAWLSNFVPSRHSELQMTDNTLLAGHLKLIRTLFTCEGVSKEKYGEELVSDLLHDFLFPASKLMMDNVMQVSDEAGLAEFNPKCSKQESRRAAFELLMELCNNCAHNLQLVCRQLLAMHHQHNTDCANLWEYMPPVDGRAPCGYVGLKNGGATCYMNSVLQQLYMVPGVPESVLSVDEDQPEEDSVFNQVQQMFGHLMESKLQSHEPEQFWSVFRLWGQTINIREQQDAFDFFQAVTDQIDEHMKRIGKEEIFKTKFQGKFSDQKICKDCPHRYEREEAFIALNLTVKNATLQDSLDQFVKGELLEGDNAYFCEKCGEKRNTIKRMCIKTLPPLLCIQLKRFGYDWETNRALKFDDYFKFPWILNMEPYTAEGMAWREASDTGMDNTDAGSTAGDFSQTPSMNGDMSDSGSTSSSCGWGNGDGIGGAGDVVSISVSLEQQPKSINYELVGIVVHSGQANAGHYYSFIKDRRGTVLTNPNKGKWFKFNDTIVEEFDMTDVTVEQECFGGTYKAKVFDSTSSYPEDRLRYWNGYLLFYERMEEPPTPTTAKRSRILSRRLLPEGGKRSLDSNSLMELTELVHKGEQRGIFMDRMPAPIQQAIHAENITFVKNRDVYNPDYFAFLLKLVSKNTEFTDNPQYSIMCVNTLQLGVKFLVNTYLRTRQKTQADMDEWILVLGTLISRCKDACLWLIDFLSGPDGSQYIKPFLLECPLKEVRVMFAKILELTMSSFLAHGGVYTHKSFDSLVDHLLCMLEKDVIDYVRHCAQYFLVLKSYIHIGTKACAHMFGRHGFQRLIYFLLGNTMNGVEDLESSIRRWSSMQAREFSHLHSALATLVLNCDVSEYRTESLGGFPPRLPETAHPHIFLKMSVEMQKFVFGTESVHYLKEVVLAVRELVASSLPSVMDMLVYCSFCNQGFSLTIIKLIMLQYMNAPSNELKPVFNLLTGILKLEDPLQLTRLKWIIDGYIDDKGNKYEGLISIIRLNHVSDSRRSYQCIKFLVALSSQSIQAKEYLLHTPSKWQWAVNWLKKKMTEYYWSTSSTANLSNDDSNRKSFQRTQSAQNTLQEATALLTEIEGLEASSGTEAFSTNVTIRTGLIVDDLSVNSLPGTSAITTSTSTFATTTTTMATSTVISSTVSLTQSEVSARERASGMEGTGDNSSLPSSQPMMSGPVTSSSTS